MCAELSVSRSGSYAWRTRPVCDWARNDAELTEVIIALHDELRGNPGVRRMRAELNAQGIRIGLKRVWRLMKTLGCVDAIPDSGDAPPSPASNRCRHPT